MSQYLRCNKACQAPSMLCDQCRSLIQQHVHNDAPHIADRVNSIDISTASTSPLPAVPGARDDHKQQQSSASYDLIHALSASVSSSGPLLHLDADQLNEHSEYHASSASALQEPVTPVAFPIGDPVTPPPSVREPEIPSTSPDVFAEYTKNVEQALSKLSDAARRIAAVDQGLPQVSRTPRASRLAPLYDISADIHRDSTPLPRTAYSTEPERRTPRRRSILSDIWPLMPDIEEDAEPDIWTNHTDPLQARHLPSSAEMLQIEAEERRLSTGGPTDLLPPLKYRNWHLRLIFSLLAILAICALAVDTVLVSFAVLNPPHPHKSMAAIPPSITLSPSVVHYGDNVIISIHGFSSSTRVSLS